MISAVAAFVLLLAVVVDPAAAAERGHAVHQAAGPQRRPGQADSVRQEPEVQGGAEAQGAAEVQGAAEAQGAAALTLDELERLALANNPTLAQAGALIEEAGGNRDQAGRYPNPQVGFAAEEIAFKDPGRTSEHLFVAEQAILLGSKRARRAEVFAYQEERAGATARAQRERVLNGVRILYYRAVAAAELVAIHEQLAEVAGDGALTTRELENVGQADRADALAARVEARGAEVELEAARADQRRVWQQLGAMVGEPGLSVRRLASSIDAEPPRLEFDEALRRLLAESPELDAVRAALGEAEAVLRREGAEVTPDLLVRSGIGYNFDRFELGPEAVGAEMFVEAMIELPLFDRRQGTQMAATARIARAREEVVRMQLSLRSRLAEVFADYAAELIRVDAYRDEMIPAAAEAAELYRARFEQMGAAYPQVLVSRRDLLQLRAAYVRSWERLWRWAVTIRGALLVDGLASVGP